jgi:hypothetical protein
MKRNAEIAEKFPDPVREAVNLPIGIEGEFFVGITKNSGQVLDKSVVDYNKQPSTQPSLWCSWIAHEDGSIEWDGGETFYNYVDWIKYLIQHFIAPWGFTLNGKVKWHGEDPSDSGVIVVNNNIVTTKVN